MAAPPPADEILVTWHLLHQEFGRRLATLVIRRGAKLALGLNTANMPVKDIVTSLSGSIDPVFIAEAVKSYTDSLFTKQVPPFDQLVNMPVSKGFKRSKQWFWYLPWTKVALDTAPITSVMEHKDPVLKMAGTQQVTDAIKAGHTGKESLLGYHWNPASDSISTDKGQGMNLHPAKQGLCPDWAHIKEADDLLRLHAQRPLRLRHALAAAHGYYNPLASCPWVAALNKFTYRLLNINTELQTSEKKNDKSKYDDILSIDYVKNHMYYMVAGNLTTQSNLTQSRTWRLPVCVNYSNGEVELDSLSDGDGGPGGRGVPGILDTKVTLGQRGEGQHLPLRRSLRA